MSQPVIPIAVARFDLAIDAPGVSVQTSLSASRGFKMSYLPRDGILLVVPPTRTAKPPEVGMIPASRIRSMTPVDSAGFVAMVDPKK